LSVKFAVTETSSFIVMMQAPVPLQPPPLHPSKVEASGVAVKVTVLPKSKIAKQLDGQEIPDGLLAILPPPLPALDIVRRGRTRIKIVAGALSSTPSLALKVKLSTPMKPSFGVYVSLGGVPLIPVNVPFAGPVTMLTVVESPSGSVAKGKISKGAFRTVESVSPNAVGGSLSGVTLTNTVAAPSKIPLLTIKVKLSVPLKLGDGV